MIPQHSHPSWSDFFLMPRTQELLTDVQRHIQCPVNPSAEHILRFAQMPLASVRCVILGQDPYPDPTGVAATGRAFEVGGLTSWQSPFRQHSLKNLLRAIHRTYTGTLISYPQLKEKMASGEFVVLAPDALFENLESQGVLFLNVSLTCEQGVANSHRELWRPFAAHLLRYLSQQRPDTHWFLWGTEAQRFSPLLEGTIHQCKHPRLYGVEAGDFLMTDCFQQTMDFIDWRGRIIEN